MSGVPLIILIVLAFLAVLGIRALTNSATGHAFDAAGRAFEKRRPPAAAVITALGTSEALLTAQRVAQELDPEPLVQDLGEGQLLVTFEGSSIGSESAINVNARLDSEQHTRLELRSASQGSGEAFGQFRGALIAALRQRDSGARQARK